MPRFTLLIVAIASAAAAGCVRGGFERRGQGDGRGDDAPRHDGHGHDRDLAPRSDVVADGNDLWRTLLPSNILEEVPLDAGTAGPIVGKDWPSRIVVSTDDGSIVSYTEDGAKVTHRPAGEGVASGIWFSVVAMGEVSYGVFAMASLEIRTGARVKVSGTRAAVLLVRSEALIAGLLSAAGDTSGPGPGGFPGGLSDKDGDGYGGGHAGKSGGCGGGGAGGSFGGKGGSGGAGDASAGGTPAATYGAAALVPLLGGSGGGGGGGPGATQGGNGGGALQLTAGVRIVVATGGKVDACGGGGGGAPGNPYGGSGGASGGGLILEAPVVEISGLVGANGGAGGLGGPADSVAGASGPAGRPDIVPAPGPSYVAPYGAAGGNGSDASGTASNGGGGLDRNGGGGGGGGGRVRINTLGGGESYTVGVTPTMASGLTTVGAISRK
jgi:hypothetical protein